MALLGPPTHPGRCPPPGGRPRGPAQAPVRQAAERTVKQQVKPRAKGVDMSGITENYNRDTRIYTAACRTMFVDSKWDQHRGRTKVGKFRKTFMRQRERDNVKYMKWVQKYANNRHPAWCGHFPGNARGAEPGVDRKRGCVIDLPLGTGARFLSTFSCLVYNSGVQGEGSETANNN